jgi:hypothetical protein
MVIVDMRVAFASDFQIKQTMLAECFEHVVEKTYISFYTVLPGAIDFE